MEIHTSSLGDQVFVQRAKCAPSAQKLPHCWGSNTNPTLLCGVCWKHPTLNGGKGETCNLVIPVWGGCRPHTLLLFTLQKEEKGEGWKSKKIM